MNKFWETYAGPIAVAATLGIGTLVGANTLTNATQDVRLNALEGITEEVRETKDVLNDTKIELQLLNERLKNLQGSKDE